MRPCLFIWIPRAGGTSVKEALMAAADNPAYLSRNPRDWKPSHDFLTFSHWSIAALIRRGIFPLEEVQRRFVFTIVRNPWDRLVSLWHYFSQHPGMHRLMQYQKAIRFRRFAARVCCHPIANVGFYNYCDYSQANEQVEWLDDWMDGERWQPDYIGRFECYKESWREICEALGVSVPLLHRHASKRKNPTYQQYYNSPIRDMVAEFYARDIQRFGYRF